VPLDQDVINIGRNWDNQIVIDDPSVSRLHVQLRRRDHQYLLFDADSRSGTLVNNVRVREHGLRSGDIIQIGETRMLYVEDDDDTGDDDLSATQAYDPVE
jgi:pSer/pThr/pTyr-binding forkhead associated (FHA) protein